MCMLANLAANETACDDGLDGCAGGGGGGGGDFWTGLGEFFRIA